MLFKLIDNNSDIVTTIISSIPIQNTEGSIIPDQYQLQAPNGSTIRKNLAEIDELADTPANKFIPVDFPLPLVTSLLVWLQRKSKVSMFKSGKYHKGFIIQASDGSHHFSCCRQLNSPAEVCGVDLPSFGTSWPCMSCDNIMLPSWNINIYSRLGLFPSSNPFDRSGELIAANHVSARTLRSECPKSLQEALANDLVDRATWLPSYIEEKEDLVDNQMFVRLTLKQYRELWLKKNVPQVIPSMCVFTVKKDEHGDPDCAKSRIVVLGNLEERMWEKSERYAPILQYSSLCLLTSMAIEKRRHLKQGDYKNAFMQASLPEDKPTIMWPPLGDSDTDFEEFWLLKKSLYGLARAPVTDMTTSLCNIGLTPSASDLCLFIGVPSTAEHPVSEGDKPIQIGIYVEDFVYYSEDKVTESRFENIFKLQFKIDVMVTVNWFLGTHFEWANHPDRALFVHLSQKAFVHNLVERHCLNTVNFNPSSLPYRSGYPIDSIKAAEVDKDDPTFIWCRCVYQSLVGSLNWLATNTRSNLLTIVSFLA